jgi:hypothetical protein
MLNKLFTCLLQVEELREKRTTWTMQGWRVTLKDGTQVMRAEPMVLPTTAAADTEKRDVEERMEEEGEKEKEEEGEEEEEEDEEKDDEG